MNVVRFSYGAVEYSRLNCGHSSKSITESSTSKSSTFESDDFFTAVFENCTENVLEILGTRISVFVSKGNREEKRKNFVYQMSCHKF